MENQLTIFDILYPKYKITKPIRLIEFFAGYGSQALALKYLGVKFEHWRICEWAVKSIQAYKDIHFSNIDLDFSGNLTKDNLVKVLYELGISSNYNEPMTKKQIERLSEQQLKTIWNNIVTTKNLVNIQQVKGEDLGIIDTDKYDYILTYSFPCQDLSLAGKGKGMSDTSTRSGLLWEVERILKECKELEKLPQVLLMENVPQVHGADNVADFNKWQLELEKLGYKNYFQDLIATDYGIPQTRNRTFMVSILGDYSYTFPQPIPLKLKLKDMLEDNVDEKYFLSDKMINCLLSESENSKFPRKERFLSTLNTTNNKGIAATLCTTGGTRPTDNYVLKNKSLQETLEKNEISDTCYIDTYNKKINEEKSGTITTGVSFRNNTFLAIKKETENYIEWEEKGKLDIDCRASKEDKVSTTICTTPKNKVLIKNATKKGYLEAEDGDGIDISSRMEHHRGTVQKGKTQTITTMGGENNGVVVDTLKRDLCNKLIEDGLVEEGDVVKHSYTSQILEGNKKCVEKNDGNMITLTTRGDCVGVCVGTYDFSSSEQFLNGQSRFEESKGTFPTLRTQPKEGVVTIGNYSPSNHNASRVVDQEYSAPTVMENHGTITAIVDNMNKNAKHQQDIIQSEDGNSRTLVSGTHGNGGHYTKTLMNDLRIRKLTPCECFRLMGVKDEDFEKCAKNQSDSSLYHLAGDSIVVNVLMAIFKELL